MLRSISEVPASMVWARERGNEVCQPPASIAPADSAVNRLAVASSAIAVHALVEFGPQQFQDRTFGARSTAVDDRGEHAQTVVPEACKSA